MSRAVVVQRFDEETELVVIAGIQQLQIHPAVDPVPRRGGPGSPVTSGWLIEPAGPGVLTNWSLPISGPARGCVVYLKTAVRLAAPATAGRAPAAARTDRTIVPDPPGAQHDPSSTSREDTGAECKSPVGLASIGSSQKDNPPRRIGNPRVIRLFPIITPTPAASMSAANGRAAFPRRNHPLSWESYGFESPTSGLLRNW